MSNFASYRPNGYQTNGNNNINMKLSTTQRIDGLVYDTYNMSINSLLGRHAIMHPTFPDPIITQVEDSGDYCRQIMSRIWKLNITLPLIFELHINNPVSGEAGYIIERWIFHYQRREDARDYKISDINFKLKTFIRSLYTMIRLLPSFQLLKFTSKLSTVTFHLYPLDTGSTLSSLEMSNYEFPKLNTSKGILHVSMRFIDGHLLQQLLKTPIFSSPNSVPFRTSQKLSNSPAPMQRPSLGTQGSGRIPLSSQKSIPRSNAIPIGNNISASPNISTRGRRNSQDNAYESSRLSEGRHSRTNSIDYSSNMNIITGQSRTPPTNTPPYPFTNRLSNRQSPDIMTSGSPAANYGYFLSNSPGYLQMMNQPRLSDEKVGISPPLTQQQPLTLLSTSPQITSNVPGSEIQSLMLRARRNSMKASSHKIEDLLSDLNFDSLKHSPFSKEFSTLWDRSKIKEESMNLDVEEQEEAAPGLELSLNTTQSFIKDTIRSAELGIPMDALVADTFDDEDANNRFTAPMSMGFIRSSSAEKININEEETFDVITPLSINQWNTTISPEFISEDTTTQSMSYINDRIRQLKDTKEKYEKYRPPINTKIQK